MDSPPQGPTTPAEMQAYILERLVGDTGEPDRMIEAARSLATRAIPAIRHAVNADLGFPLEIELGPIEMGRLQDAKPVAAGFDAMIVAASLASPDALVLTIDADAIALVVSAAFGGDADSAPAAIHRDLSPIELDIAATVMSRFITVLNGSGARGLAVKFPLPAPLAGAELQKQGLRDGPSVRIVFMLRSPAASGRLVLTMPQRLLMKPRGEGGAANEHDLAATQPQFGARLGEEVMRSGVSLEAVIPMAPMTLGEIASLSVGQVIEIPLAASGETRLSARGKTLFLCEYGKLGARYTVRINRPFDAGEDFINGLMSA